MRKTFARLVQAILALPPKYFYAIWACGVLCIIFVVWWNTTPEPIADFAPRNDRLRYSITSDSISTAVDAHEQLLVNSLETTLARAKIEKCLNELEPYIARRVRQEFSSTPDFVSQYFEATGIDRDKFLPRSAGAPIQVQRWRKSETAPSFDDDDTLNRLIESCFSPWSSVADFKVDAKPFDVKFEGQSVLASLAIECFGSTSRGTGRQCTSIWKSEWTRQGDRLNLQAVSVLAQEEVTVSVSGGKIFQDCTASILRDCDSLGRQLVFGLDQWAKRIPSLDIVGMQGIAVGDVNHDGLDDLYVCQPHGLSNLLLVQNTDGTVRDDSARANVDILDSSHAALFVDIDNDRDQDLVVTTDENLVLFSNTGTDRFQLEDRLPIGRGAGSVAAADFDNDGDLDLYLCKFSKNKRSGDLQTFPESLSQPTGGGRNVLLRNDEGWKFTDVTEEVGFGEENRAFSRAASWVDFDRDGDLDLFVANEFSSDKIYRNDAGKFTQIPDLISNATASRHRTISVGEFNQDGRLDFFVGAVAPLDARDSFAPNVQVSDTVSQEAKEIFCGEDQIWYSNPSENGFQAYDLRAPIFTSESVFGSVAADLNNDGLDDIVVANGLLTRESNEDLVGLFFDNTFTIPSSANDFGELVKRTLRNVSEMCRKGFSLGGRQRNRCFFSLGQLGFANLSAVSGLDLPDDARAVVATDWDHDGDIDIIMTCRTGPQLRIFCNQLDSENEFVSFDLFGTRSNADAIGARIELFLAGRPLPLVKVIGAGSGFLGQSSKHMVFGLGPSPKIEKAIVTWPSGIREEFDSFAANTNYRIIEGRGQLTPKSEARLELAIGRQPLQPTNSTPSNERTIFFPQSSLPSLMFEGSKGTYYPLENLDEHPLLILFFADDENSNEALRRIWNSSDELKRKKLDCLALYCIQSNQDADQIWHDANIAVNRSRFPFRWGVLTPASQDKFRYMFGEWFFQHALPQFPFALLLDESGNVACYYADGQIDPKTIVDDVRLLASDELAYRDAAAVFGGKWAARYRHANFDRVMTRLKEVGYGEDIVPLSENERPFTAYRFCQQAIEFAALGDTDSAKQSFARAKQFDDQCVMAFVGNGNLLRNLANEKAEDLKIATELRQQSARDFEAALAIEPGNEAAATGLANLLVDQGKTNEALSWLENHLSANPDCYEVQAMIGRLNFQQKKYREAAENLVTAYSKRPSLHGVSGDLGFLYLISGEYKLAEKFLKSAYQLQPSENNLARLLAEAEFANGNNGEAIERLTKVVEQEPKRRRPKLMLAWLLATSPIESQRDSSKSLEIIGPIYESAGDDSLSVMEIQAAALAASGDFEQALDVQRTAARRLAASSEAGGYTTEQQEGLKTRLALYQREQTYRTGPLEKNPIRPPSSTAKSE